MIRIASIDNLSARAFRLCTPDFAHSLRIESPARVAALMAAGHCDAALVPVAALRELRGSAISAGDYGIACTGAVRSVQVFSSLPLSDIVLARQPIYATSKSRTSVELLRLLCLQQYRVLPNLTASYGAASAHLLIGDAAFEYAQRHGTNPNHVDLGAWWQAQTRLPFVYARWVVSARLDTRRRASIISWLEACATRMATPEGREALRQGPEFAPEDHLALQVYYQHLRNRLTMSDQAGQNRFLQLMEYTSHARTAPVA